ncbi:MAG: DUF4391 domain-containing protein [Acinetobacter sp.]|nr:MAG: DUF4391 domain-containing protein [Acinetobacter sp.]
MTLYLYPEQAKVDRLIPKNKFYAQGKASGQIEQLFVEQVESIRWAYKLDASTIHMQDKDDLKEIQIFHIQSRVENFDTAILAYIDKLIPSPIIYEVYFNDTVKTIATYKRLNQADKTKVVIGQYYATAWQHDINRIALPIFLHLSDLYEHFIYDLLPYQLENSVNSGQDDIEAQIARNQRIEQLTKQIAKLSQSLKREKQFNRQVEINRKITELRQKLEQIYKN